MNPTSENRWLARTRWAGAGLSILLGVALLETNLGQGLVGLSYDSLFLLRGNIPVAGVTILYMDLDSENRLGITRMQSWDRDIHARLLERLLPYHPRAVVFDILFESETVDPRSDAHLVRAAAAISNVVVAGRAVPQVYEGEVLGWRLARPFTALREVVSWGMAQAADDDGNIRQEYHRRDYDAPSLPWRAAERAGLNPLPDPFAPRWINYYGPPGWFPHLSYYEVLETNRVSLTSLASLSNQVIFVGGLFDIGFAGGKRSDDYRTPYTLTTKRRAPGVEISATAYLNLVRKDSLRRLPSWAELGLVVLCGGLAGFGLASFRPWPATGCALLAAVLVGGLTLVATWGQHFWFPWLIVSALQIPTALVWSAVAQTRHWQREKRFLEQMVAITQAGVIPEDATAAVAVTDKDSGPVSPARLGSPVRGSESTRALEPLAPLPAGGELHERPVVPDHALLRTIGKGAYGEVWLARDIIGSFHAVKLVHRRSFRDLVPFEREFNGIRRFTPISRSHPGFVHILHVGRNEGGDYLYYVMELGDDESTGQRIEPEKYTPKTLASELQRRQRLPLAECLAVTIPLADALDFLHRQQLIHRDIKPSNIIFVRGAPKFADVGLVTDIAEEGRATYLGTDGYIAPEGPGTAAADVFSLGRVIYEAGFGMKPDRFPELPTTIVENASTAPLNQLNRILLKACALDSSRRYSSAGELRGALAALQQQLQAGTNS